MITGIVIGKFYPYHRGHKYLIETALNNCDQLTVLVCDLPSQKIPARVRTAWIKETHPQADVRIIPDLEHDDDSRFWAKYTISFLGYRPDMVFTSEDYGLAYAKFMGAKHIMVDRKRLKIPISGTTVRKNPLKYWKYLEPCVRAYFTKRVCVLGAESTGTTTISRELARHYRTVWVPEYGRMYSEGKMLNHNMHWDTQEFVFIAKEQNKIEDALAKISRRILFCDTNAFATYIWHKRYLGFFSPLVEKVGFKRKYDLYLLTDVDIPFVQDGTRDGEHIRKGMHDEFIKELKKRNVPHVLLSGNRQSRLQKAIRACDKILANKEWEH